MSESHDPQHSHHGIEDVGDHVLHGLEDVVDVAGHGVGGAIKGVADGVEDSSAQTQVRKADSEEA